MIKKQLIQTIPESKKYIAGNVIFQWLALVSNIVLMTIITTFIAGRIDGGSGIGKYNFSNSEHFVKSGVGKLQNERGCAMINGCKGICCEGIEQSYAKQ